MTAASGREAGSPGDATVPFPSLSWFQRLADLMNANRLRQEQLGYVDCVVEFRVDGDARRQATAARVRFVEFSAVEVRGAENDGEDDAVDFVLAAPLEIWRRMIESIAAGGGRPDLEQTLNYLTHMGAPMEVRSRDPLRRDLYFRYNQSLQEFVNASAAFRTAFPD